jgi:pimeloyl-ACP methyl ester carboxylesterase
VSRGRLLLALTAVVASLALPGPAQGRLPFRACEGIGCTRLSVPLDRSGTASGRISLYVERRRAVRPRRGVTLLLAGGPGQPATLAYGGFRSRDSYNDFAALTPHNDIVAFDGRGTGRSGVLRCPELEGASLVDAGHEAALCALRLGRRRGFYRTSDTVEDIEALRAALGVQRLTLIGVSYGTLVAQAYAARYPNRVERVLLDSVLDVSGWDPFYRDIFRAVPRVLGAVCRSGCETFTRDPAADLGRLVQRLSKGALRGRVTLPNGRRRRTALTRQELFFTLLAGDLDDVARSAFPGAVSAAVRGDFAPILRLKRRALRAEGAGGPREFSTALYAATTCEEIPFPWTRFSDPASRFAEISAAAAQIPIADLNPFDTATAAGNDFIRMCRRWPEASPAPPPAPPPGALPDVPVLMVSGELDLRTPVETARGALADWPHARLLVAPHTGHSTLSADLSGCVLRAARRFLRGGSVPSRCRRGRTPFPPIPPPPASLTALRPVPGVRGRLGQTVRAVEVTLLDVADGVLGTLLTSGDLRLRGGGLRAGRWSIDFEAPRAALVLHQVEVVPGVRVTGVVRDFGRRRQRARLRLSGPAAPDGVLDLAGARVRGTLGGRPVRGSIVIGVVEDAGAAGADVPPALVELMRAGRELAERPRQR